MKRYLPILVFVMVVISIPFFGRAFNGIDDWQQVIFLFITVTTLYLFAICAKTRLNSGLNIIDVFVSAYLLYSVIRIFFSGGVFVEPLFWCKWVLFIVIYIAGKFIAKSGGAKLLIFGIFVSCIIQAIASLFCNVFINSGHLGAYLAIGISGMAALILLNGHEWKRHGIIVRGCILLGILICIVCLLLTRSRGAIVAVIGALIYILFETRFYKVLNKKVFLSAISAIIVVAILVSAYFIRPESANARLLVWRVCGEIFAESPLFGTSPGSLSSLYMYAQANFFADKVASPLIPYATNHYQSFNEFIHLLCELGTTGLLLFGVILILCFGEKSGNRAVKSSFIALIIVSFFLYTMDIPVIAIFFPLFIGALGEGCRKIFYKRLNAIQSRNIKIIVSGLFIGAMILFGSVYLRYEKMTSALVAFAEDKNESNLNKIQGDMPLVLSNKNFALFYGSNIRECSDKLLVLNTLINISQKIVTVEMITDIGLLYSEAKTGNDTDISKAEHYFILAHNMAPDRMIPRYLLFDLYRNSGQPQKAFKMANEILNYNPRIYNSATVRLKHQARIYLNQKNI